MGRPKRHGHASTSGRSPTYLTWMSMHYRCERPQNASFSRYGAIGIGVCDRWSSFDAFLEDMGVRPEGMTLDRIDRTRGYEPGNCRWATVYEQARNHGSSKLTAQLVQEIHGRCEHGETQRSIARRLGISQSTVSEIRNGKLWPDQVQT